MILLIDNYDSFTYNLVQRLGEMDPALDLRSLPQRPDHASTRSRRCSRRHIIISPGPCTPREAGISNEVLERFAPTVPILGVCLGHQCIGHVFGGEVIRNYRDHARQDVADPPRRPRASFAACPIPSRRRAITAW